MPSSFTTIDVLVAPDELAESLPGYVVFCRCGSPIPVTSSMAGLLMDCSGCGKQIEVPSLSLLR